MINNTDLHSRNHTTERDLAPREAIATDARDPASDEWPMVLDIVNHR
jgi:hypothetical protein